MKKKKTTKLRARITTATTITNTSKRLETTTKKKPEGVTKQLVFLQNYLVNSRNSLLPK